MEIYKKLYLDKTIQNQEEILQMLSDGVSIYNLYLIVIDKKGQSFFEILESSEIFKKINKRKQYVLIGICYGKENAFKIIKDIFQKYVILKKDLHKIKIDFLKNK